jgi:hypothetical protein
MKMNGKQLKKQRDVNANHVMTTYMNVINVKLGYAFIVDIYANIVLLIYVLIVKDIVRIAMLVFVEIVIGQK